MAQHDGNSRLLIGSREKNVGWYNPELTSLTEAQRDLFENYSHIAPDRIIPHILKRDEAWEFLPLPCIGQFRFIDFALSCSPSYAHILERLKSGAKLLDLGCCLGQDLRKLVHDGAPPEAVFGGELRKDFVDKGYDLFLDRDTFGVKFFIADIFDAHSALNKLENQLDIVHMGLFLHLFDWDGQRKACERIVRLLKNQEGVFVMGQQVGNIHPQDVPFGTSQKVFRHDEKSFERLWREVGESTGSEWMVRATLDNGLGVGEKKRTWDDEHTRRLMFEVERIR